MSASSFHSNLWASLVCKAPPGGGRGGPQSLSELAMLVCIPASATPAGFGSVAGPSDLNAIRTRRATGTECQAECLDPEDDRLWTAVFRLAVGQNSSADGSARTARNVAGHHPLVVDRSVPMSPNWASPATHCVACTCCSRRCASEFARRWPKARPPATDCSSQTRSGRVL
jgi:hypothetical protein